MIFFCFMKENIFSLCASHMMLTNSCTERRRGRIWVCWKNCVLFLPIWLNLRLSTWSMGTWLNGDLTFPIDLCWHSKKLRSSPFRTMGSNILWKCLTANKWIIVQIRTYFFERIFFHFSLYFQVGNSSLVLFGQSFYFGWKWTDEILKYSQVSK